MEKFLWEEKQIEDIRLTRADRDEILRYVGYSGQDLSEQFESSFLRCMERINTAADPHLMACMVDCDDGWPDAISFLTGNDIRAHLEGCHQVILFGATIGTEVDRVIRIEQMKDAAQALIMDACGSTLIESVCDHFEAILRKRYADREPKRYLTSRFSPGYGDLPLAVQNHFCEVIEGRRIGLTVTPEHIMIPRKSVTAVMGLSHHPTSGPKQNCGVCNMKDVCRFRKHGVRCEA